MESYERKVSRAAPSLYCAREVLIYRESADLKMSQQALRSEQGGSGAEAGGSQAGGGTTSAQRPRGYSGLRARRTSVIHLFMVPQSTREGEVGMGKQGTWTRWEHVTGRQITWADLWKTEPHQFMFLVRSVYDRVGLESKDCTKAEQSRTPYRPPKRPS